MSAFKIIEDNPGVAIALGAIVIVILLTRGGGGNQAMINAQLQSQKMAGETNVQLSGINARAAMARSANVTDLYKTQVSTASALAMTNSTIAGKVQLGSMDFNARMAAIQSGEAIQRAAITSKQVTAADQFFTLRQINQNNNDLKQYNLDLTSRNLPLIFGQQLALAPINASNSQAMAEIAARNAQAVAMISGQNAQAIAALNTSAARTNAQTNQDTQSSKSDMGWLGAIGNIASLFF